MVVWGNKYKILCQIVILPRRGQRNWKNTLGLIKFNVEVLLICKFSMSYDIQMFCPQSKCQIQWNFIPDTFLPRGFLQSRDVLNFVGKWIFLSPSVGERSIHIRLFVFISLTHPTVHPGWEEEEPKIPRTWQADIHPPLLRHGCWVQSWRPLLSISGYRVFSVLIDISLANVRQLSFLWSLFVHPVGMLSSGGSFLIPPLSWFLPLAALFHTCFPLEFFGMRFCLFISGHPSARGWLLALVGLGMQRTRGGSPFSTGCQLRAARGSLFEARGSLFDGCGSQECRRAPPPPRPTTHYPQPVQTHTTFFQRMQRTVQPVQTCSEAGEPVAAVGRWRAGRSCSRWSGAGWSCAQLSLGPTARGWGRRGWREKFGVRVILSEREGGRSAVEKGEAFGWNKVRISWGWEEEGWEPESFRWDARKDATSWCSASHSRSDGQPGSKSFVRFQCGSNYDCLCAFIINLRLAR